MTPNQLKIFKEQIIAAVDAHLSKGGKLISGSFGSNGSSEQQIPDYCPISCLIADVSSKQSDGYKSYTQRLNIKMGFEVSENEMMSFAYGFDDGEIQRCPQPSPEMYAIGQEIYKKYRGVIS
jgi:hypothetical protein